MSEDVTPPPPSRPLTGPLLAAVSRSFYLSLRFLPPPVRDGLSVSYLLARAADTVADVDTRPAEERRKLLALLMDAVTRPDPETPAAPLLAEFGESVTHAGERELLDRFPECLALLRARPEAERALIHGVLTLITRGMVLDLERFPDASRLRCLLHPEELEEYTWLVAGCVGEFWTDICALNLPGVFRVSPDEMRALAKSYGQALQLINILRDQPKDAALGRCYLSETQLRAAGLSGEVSWPPEDLGPWREVRRDRIAAARRGLEAGREYVRNTRSIRLRFAALMPLLIGSETLDLMEKEENNGPPRAVKVPRSAVKRLLRRAAWRAFTGKV